MTVPDTRKHPTALDETTLAYVGARSSNAKYLLAENEQMTKLLQVGMQEAEQS